MNSATLRKLWTLFYVEITMPRTCLMMFLTRTSSTFSILIFWGSKSWNTTFLRGPSSSVYMFTYIYTYFYIHTYIYICIIYADQTPFRALIGSIYFYLFRCIPNPQSPIHHFWIFTTGRNGTEEISRCRNGLDVKRKSAMGFDRVFFVHKKDGKSKGKGGYPWEGTPMYLIYIYIWLI